jgi:hypothetical protein
MRHGAASAVGTAAITATVKKKPVTANAILVILALPAALQFDVILATNAAAGNMAQLSHFRHQEFSMSNQMTPLRRRMIDDMMIRNLSPLTQKIYVRAVVNFSIFHFLFVDQAALAASNPLDVEWLTGKGERVRIRD